MPTLLGRILNKVNGIFQEHSGATDRIVTPENVVRSIPERWLDSSVRRHVAGMQVIRHAEVERYSYPDGLPPAFRTEMHFARRHVYHLTDVAVNTKTGACASSSWYFQESYGSLRRCLVDKPFPASHGRAVKQSQPLTSIHSVGYYHFLLEEVPRLLQAVEYCNAIIVLVHRSAPGYVFDALDHMRRLGVLASELLVLDEECVTLSDYIFTQAEAYSGFVNMADIHLVRNTLLATLEVTAESPRNIYISRKNSHRSFNNEDEIIELMDDLGFHVCYLEEMGFEAQIRLFAVADVIVAPHGSGLANLLWCGPGTRVVELFSPHCFNDCYARLCSQLGLGYKPLWADNTNPWGRVSLDELSDNLRQT